MTSIYYYKYNNSSDYDVIQKFSWGEERIIPKSSSDLAAWIAKGNTPEKIAGNQFVSFSNGNPVYDSTGAASYTLKQLQDGLKGQMDSLMVQDVAIPVVVLYLAESALVTGGVITNAQRIIPAATAANYATYLREIVKAYIAAKNNPASVSWPIPPVMPV
jgi:hypothetical protein